MKDHRVLDDTASRQALYRAMLTLRTTTECEAFLRDLCTPAEIQAMADRWVVAERLADGLPYRQIHDRTGVSVTTIGRVARCLNDGAGGYATALRRLRRTPQGDSRR
jgi:TrpR-related protein YerC/YecD